MCPIQMMMAYGFGKERWRRQGGEGIVKMDAIRITEVVKELTSLLQNMSEHGEGYDGKIVERVESEVNKLKEELGSWFIDDFEIYQAS
jgi:response regulator RpfG family c-di-GMP phosphodiesterase